MDQLDRLHEKANEPPRALWQLRTWEVAPEQLGERELAIRGKTQELADRNNEVEGAISTICEIAGVTRVTGTGDRVKYATSNIELPANPRTGERVAATVSKYPNGSAYVRYFEIDENNIYSEIPRSQQEHTSIFDIEDTTNLTLKLQYGSFTWSRDRADYDNSRIDILEAAESVVGAWEGTTEMLLQAMRNPDLNPEFAERMAQKVGQAANKAEGVASFLGGTSIS